MRSCCLLPVLLIAFAAQAQQGPVTHRLTPAAETQLEMSHVAQAIEAYFPELVKTDPGSGLKSVRPALLTPVLLQTGKLLSEELARGKAQLRNPDGGDEPQTARIAELHMLISQLQSARLLLAVMALPASANVKARPKQ